MNAANTGIRVNHLQKTFQQGRVRACRDVNLAIAPGELLVLLGPSGCGKTTTLRCIAGLERPDNDDAIWVGEQNITGMQPKDRNLAFVFQDTALFPHLNARKNISFGLNMRKTFPAAEIRRKVEATAKMLRVDHLLERKPSQLSGGQAQRISLGRAIVMEPAAFLLDEPLASLDAALRVEMRAEIKQIQRKLNTTMIFVTHDQEEALSLGDQIAVMNEGVVLQVGSPASIYLKPANLFVARFIGSPPVNQFECELVQDGGGYRLRCAWFEVSLGAEAATLIDAVGGKVTLGVRPEFISLGSEGGDIEGRVTLVEMLGSRSVILIEAQGREIRVSTQGGALVKEGDPVRLTLAMDRAFFFAPDGRALVG